MSRVGALLGLDSAATSALIAAELADSPVLVTPALGTPASGNLANCTGYPVKVRQVAVKTISAKISGTTQIPTDDTIPQSTEGVAWISSDAFVPTAADSIILVKFVGLVQTSATASISWAIFDGGANAIDSDSITHTGSGSYNGAGIRSTAEFSSKHIAASTDSRVYSVRLGPNGSATIQNYGPGDDFGGISQLGTLEIWELAP